MHRSSREIFAFATAAEKRQAEQFFRSLMGWPARVPDAEAQSEWAEDWTPPAFVPPESVVEMEQALDDAEGLLVDPAFLDRRVRRRLYGPGPSPAGWRPDVPGSLRHLDACLDFVRPLVEPANITAHGRDDLKATVLNLFHTTDWLRGAADRYAEVRKKRDALGAAPSASDALKVAEHAKGALAFRAAEQLKVLADEGLSFEVELGSSPRAAPPYDRTLRAQLPGGPSLSKREVRMLAWLRDQKDLILQAEKDFGVDRRAIAAVIAWEAMHNIMRGGLRGVGPGKMHTYDSQWAGVIPLLPKGDAIPQQVEDLKLVPRPASDDQRRTLMTTPRGATTYIAAAMRAATDIAAGSGFGISHDLAALTSFYQGHDLPSWRKHIQAKKKRGATTFVAADPIAVWTMANVSYLESVLGKPPP